jgi:hypothetical protein
VYSESLNICAVDNFDNNQSVQCISLPAILTIQKTKTKKYAEVHLLMPSAAGGA